MFAEFRALIEKRMKVIIAGNRNPFDLKHASRNNRFAQNQSMAKLVILSKGMTGQSYELKVDKTTIGRVEDNTFPIAGGSVSSHHCEVLLRGSDVVIRDLNSTNGTFINGQQVTERSGAEARPDPAAGPGGNAAGNRRARAAAPRTARRCPSRNRWIRRW